MTWKWLKNVSDWTDWLWHWRKCCWLTLCRKKQVSCEVWAYFVPTTEPGNIIDISGNESLCNLGSIADCDCELGQFCLTMKLNLNREVIRTCVPCRPGTYSDEEKLEECKLCHAGSFQPSYNSTGCLKTEPGFYVDKPGSASQFKAGTGHYVNTKGATRQEACPLGQYQNETGQTFCIEADIGYFQSSQLNQDCHWHWTSGTGDILKLSLNRLAWYWMKIILTNTDWQV